MILKGKATSLESCISRSFFFEFANRRTRTGVMMGVRKRMGTSYLVIHKSFQAANDLMLVTAVIASVCRRHN